MIRWARERAGLPVELLAEKFPQYEAWEAGTAHPTMKQLETLAAKTATPFGYFFLPEPPEEALPIPDYRTVADRGVRRPSPDLLDTLYTMQRRQDWMRDFLIEQGADKLPFVGSVDENANPNNVAASIRDVLGLELNWAQGNRTWEDALRGLRDSIEEAGISVVINGVVGNNTRRTLDPQEFRGFVLSDPYAPLVFVNGKDAKAAQMFTLAHELAHLWLGQDGVFNLGGLQPAPVETEIFCNRVAAEFLVPEVVIAAAWSDAARSSDPYKLLARWFKVSPLVIARRALDLSLIEKDEFAQFYEAYLAEEDRRKESKDDGGGEFYRTQGNRISRRFADAILRAVKEGRLLYRDAYSLTGLRGQTFDRFAEKLGYTL